MTPVLFGIFFNILFPIFYTKSVFEKIEGKVKIILIINILVSVISYIAIMYVVFYFAAVSMPIAMSPSKVYQKNQFLINFSMLFLFYRPVIEAIVYILSVKNKKIKNEKTACFKILRRLIIFNLIILFYAVGVYIKIFTHSRILETGHS
jgi:hypothetical protein